MPTPLIIGAFIIAALAIIGWVITETLKVKHGYPVEDSWGRKVEPRDPAKLARLQEENAALRDQLDAVYDRLETLERIVTDRPSRLAEEIDNLKSLPPRPDKVDRRPGSSKEDK
ncbi:hypothetical protein [Sphingomicrobium astaxanthinifaciens]|uniref:hypothetical protein n=1 Tax=Sphingomicrobium astaxanthinifaciens TaxID=1227949 RepID=UPI001FCC17D0|nr:hypothetical protein [Sphingomicrobium astaxanthinifaciens]MCJ7422258.1 hypothetical protein [Sphingomicrobium astaxanthinifaciens]